MTLRGKYTQGICLIGISATIFSNQQRKMERGLKQKTISGMVWSLVQRFGVMIISFCSNLVLARLLTPEDYGVIGMLMIFISISNTFVDGGFGTALIQKKEPTQDDYSTIFYWNILVSVFLTIVLFFLSPLISNFYRLPLLSDVLKVMGTVLIINAFSVIQINILQKNLKFKKLATINIIANVFASIIAIVLAFKGFGVWSLVIRNLSCSALISIILWFSTQWKPLFVFKLQSFKSLGRFGGMVLLANLVETIYTEFQGLVIGKAFSAKDLGYYTQAKRLEEIPTLGITSAVNQASFPIYSSIQDNLPALKNLVRNNTNILSFINFPLYTILLIIAEPLFIILFSDKWIESVPYFRILCLAGAIYPITSLNTNIIKSLGKGKTYFNMQLFKRIIGVLIIIFGIKLGMLGLMWTLVINAYIMYSVNLYFAKKLLNYTVKEQISDIYINVLICLISSLPALALSFLETNKFIIMGLQIISFIAVYIIICILSKYKTFFKSTELLLSYFLKR